MLFVLHTEREKKRFTIHRNLLTAWNTFLSLSASAASGKKSSSDFNFILSSPFESLSSVFLSFLLSRCFTGYHQSTDFIWLTKATASYLTAAATSTHLNFCRRLLPTSTQTWCPVHVQSAWCVLLASPGRLKINRHNLFALFGLAENRWAHRSHLNSTRWDIHLQLERFRERNCYLLGRKQRERERENI